jgi:flagellar L-ring protein precursor FlgH
MLLTFLVLPMAQGDNLYNERSFRPLAADKRAQLPGDILTVLIYESSSASTTAESDMSRSTGASVRGGVDSRVHEAELNAQTTHSGGGTVQRQGKLLAQMSVRVVEVTSNGDLRVAGEQVLEINDDRQNIRIEGRVRPRDISDANTIMSYRLADAHISYLGDGELAKRQRPGFWAKLMQAAGF